MKVFLEFPKVSDSFGSVPMVLANETGMAKKGGDQRLLGPFLTDFDASKNTPGATLGAPRKLPDHFSYGIYEGFLPFSK